VRENRRGVVFFARLHLYSNAPASASNNLMDGLCGRVLYLGTVSLLAGWHMYIRSPHVDLRFLGFDWALHDFLSCVLDLSLLAASVYTYLLPPPSALAASGGTSVVGATQRVTPLLFHLWTKGLTDRLPHRIVAQNGELTQTGLVSGAFKYDQKEYSSDHEVVKSQIHAGEMSTAQRNPRSWRIAHSFSNRICLRRRIGRTSPKRNHPIIHGSTGSLVSPPPLPSLLFPWGSNAKHKTLKPGTSLNPKP
jgi:hypothetical protein